MANILYYPHLNPVKFYQPAPDETFNSRHIDDFEFFDSIPPWEEQIDYHQPWQTNDRICLQLISDFGPHTLKVIDQYGNQVYSSSFQQILQDTNNPTLWVWQLDQSLHVLPAYGVYRYQLESGSGPSMLTLQSNKMDVCQKHKHSLLLAYTHTKFHEGVFFQTGIEFFLRVEGAILFKAPGSKDDSYEDQSLDETLQYGVPYRIFELIIGDAQGVPPYMIDLINRIFTCPLVKGDNRYFTKPAGNRWDVNEQDGYPAKGWRTELREKINHPSRIWENLAPQNAKIAIVINSDSKGFDQSTGGTVTQITDVQ